MLDFPVCLRLHLAEPYNIFSMFQSRCFNPDVSINRFVQCAGICEFTVNSEFTLNFDGISILSPALEVIKRHVHVVFGNIF